jgi:membrane-associated phospholipid phosphatase
MYGRTLRGSCGSLLLASLLVVGLTGPAHAQTADPSADAGEPALITTQGLASIAAALVQNAAPPPEPEHTGFRALFSATVSDFKAFPQRESTWVILGIGGAAAFAVSPADKHLNAHLQSDFSKKFFAPGKWLGNPYVVAGSAVGLWAYGRYVEPHPKGGPRTSKLAHVGFDLIQTQLVSQAFVQGLKYTVRRDRPTGECCAFPSGHAASAFATAAVLERHFGYRNSWPALAIASYVATSRLVDDRHYISDVVFGAALGMASGWTVVGRHGKENFALTPTVVPGGAAVMISRVH